MTQSKVLELKVGSVVRLRSGGHAMTVGKIDGDVGENVQTLAWVTCQWHTESGLGQIGTFPIEALTE